MDSPWYNQGKYPIAWCQCCGLCNEHKPFELHRLAVVVLVLQKRVRVESRLTSVVDAPILKFWAGLMS